MSRIILKASAGTGKTYRLSIEFIAELLKGTLYNEILVLTFTKKATGEIKERVLEFIEKIIFQKDKSLIESVESKLQFSLNENKLLSIYEEMVKNKENIKIYTIDSFIQQIFKKVIGPNLNIYNIELIDENKNSEYYQKVLNEILQNKKNFAQLKLFFQDNKQKKVSNYYEFISSFIKERWKLKFINKIQRENLSCDEPYKYIFKLFENIEELKKTKLNTQEKSIDELIVTIFKPLIKENNNDIINKYILENSKKILETPNFFNGGKFKKAKADKPEMENLKKISQEIFQKFKEDLNRHIYNEKIIPLEKNLFEFGDYCQEIYDKYKLSEKKFTFNDLSYYVFYYFFDENLSLIEKNNCSNYLFDILEAQIKTLFIDEFQDTSVIQWSILKFFASSSLKLICVGDEKQSIYSWRGGEKKLFENLENIVSGKKESMNTCYRSSSEIINFINKYFSTISNLEEKFHWNYENVNYLSSKEGGYVETHYISKLNKKNDENDKDFDNETYLEKIIQILKNGDIKNFSNVAIISRSNSELNDIAEALELNFIPYIQSHNLCIVEHRAIKGLYFLIKYLNYKEYFYFLEFLRSDLINIDSHQLKIYIQYKNQIEDYINNGNNFDFPLNKTILDFIFQIKSMKIENFVLENNKDKFFEFMIKKLGIIEKYSSNSDLKNIYKFYEIIKNFSSLNEIIEFIEENKENEILKQTAVDELNAVTLMTIHKSKGLEFETVIYYLKEKSENNSKNSKQLFVENNDEFSEFKNYFYTDSEYFNILSNLGYNFQNIEEEKIHSEEINNIYVAMTRAKQNLFIIFENKKSESIIAESLKKAMNLEEISEIDYASKGFFKETSLNFLENDDEKSIDFIHYFDNKKFLEESLKKEKNKKIDFSLEKEFKRKTGSAAHFYLENILYNTENQLLIAKDITKARYGNMLGENLLNEVFQRADKLIFDNPEVFSEKYHIQREFEIYDNDNTYRIDRLTIDSENKEITIYDYKTGQENMEQLENYRKIIKNQVPSDYKIKIKSLTL